MHFYMKRIFYRGISEKNKVGSRRVKIAPSFLEFLFLFETNLLVISNYVFMCESPKRNLEICAVHWSYSSHLQFDGLHFGN